MPKKRKRESSFCSAAKIVFIVQREKCGKVLFVMQREKCRKNSFCNAKKKKKSL